ncbi:MAG TPA: hypothetical protein VJT73_01925 [Polyangiaceae bacterium]|nr:hypothetical protein [Polyangiaceae bacterium]
MDASGNPIEGPHDLAFSLYDKSSGGIAVYNEARPATPIRGGDFIVYLGELSGNPVVDGSTGDAGAFGLPLALFRDRGALWLEVVVDGTDIIQPRYRLASVPYAAFAQSCGDAATLGGKAPASYAYTAGAGLSLSNNQFSIPSGAVSGAMIANGAVSRAALANPLNTPGPLTVSGNLSVGGSISFTGGAGPFCIFARACPTGWVSKGLGGYIYPPGSGSCPYSGGAAFNGDWNWCHPEICCNQ